MSLRIFPDEQDRQVAIERADLDRFAAAGGEGLRCTLQFFRQRNPVEGLHGSSQCAQPVAIQFLRIVDPTAVEQRPGLLAKMVEVELLGTRHLMLLEGVRHAGEQRAEM